MSDPLDALARAAQRNGNAAKHAAPLTFSPGSAFSWGLLLGMGVAIPLTASVAVGTFIAIRVDRSLLRDELKATIQQLPFGGRVASPSDSQSR